MLVVLRVVFAVFHIDHGCSFTLFCQCQTIDCFSQPINSLLLPPDPQPEGGRRRLLIG